MLDALLEVVRAIAAESDSRRVVTALAQGACTITGAPVALVALATPGAAASDSAGERLTSSRSPGAAAGSASSAAGGPSASTEAAVGLPGPLPAPPPAVERALAARRAVAVDDLQLPGAPELRHATVVPLVHDGGMLGAVLVASRAALGATEVRALHLLVAHAALALAHADALTAAARRLARSEEHVIALGRIADATTPDAVVERALDVATTLFGADRAAVFLVDEREDVAAVYGRRLSRVYLETVGRGYRQSAGGMLHRVGAPVYIADLAADPRTRMVHDLARDEGLHSALLVPFIRAGRGLGAIALYYDVAWTFEPWELTLARSFAAQVSLSLGVAGQREAEARRLTCLELLTASLAAGAAAPAETPPARRAELVVEALARGLPSVWLFQKTAATGALTRLAHAGASAAGAHVPEEAARAALAAGTVVHHAAAGAPVLVAAPLPGARPPAALVLTPMPAAVVASRPGTLIVELHPPVQRAATCEELAAGAAAHLATVLRC